MNAAPAEPRFGPSTTRLASLQPGAIVASGAQISLGVILASIYLLAIGGQQPQFATIAVAASAAIAVVSPAAGLAMFAIIMPIRETELLAPIRVNAIMAGAITLGCVLRLPFDPIPLKVHPGFILLVGYIVISALSIPPVLSGYPGDWTSSVVNELLRFSTGVALFLSATYLFRLMSSRVFLGLALVGAVLTALLAFGDILDFLPLEGLTRGLVPDTGSMRASGTFSDPNFLGLYMAPAAVFTLAVLVVARRPLKLLLVPIAVLLLGCVVLTFSRGTYAGLVVGVAVLIGMRSRAGALAFLIVGGILALTLYPEFLGARIGATPTAGDAFGLLVSENSRMAVAAAGVAMFASSPVFGIGFGVFHFISPLYTGGSATVATYSHNQYLNILAEQGVVGILLVAGIVVLLAIALTRSRSPLRWAALAMGATYSVNSLFINSTTSFQGSCLLWLVMAAALIPGPERTAQVMEA